MIKDLLKPVIRRSQKKHSLQKPIRRLEVKLTVGYFIALIAIACMALVSSYIMHVAVESGGTASRMYNSISAQQNRIQQIALLVVALTERNSLNSAAELKKNLRSQTKELLTDHQKILDELAKESEFKWEFASIDSQAESDADIYQALDRELRTYAASAMYLGKLSLMPKNMDAISVRVVLDKANSRLTSMLADLHEKYRESQRVKAIRYERIQVFSLLMTLLGLVLVGYFLFRPMVKMVRHEHRELIKAKNRAAKANEIKSQFLANISHEIRTPLTAIIGNADMISLDPRATTSTKSRIGALKQSATYLKELIDDLLDLTKAGESKMNLNLSPVLIAEVFQQVYSTFEPKITEKGINFRVLFETPVPCELVTDPKRIKQVCFNLLGNAYKFTEQGEIAMVVSFDGSRSLLTVIVRDTGIGIDKKDQQKVFDRFGQVDSSMTRAQVGWGIGLALSQKITQQMGGNLRLIASSPAGSTFEASFCVSDASCELLDYFDPTSSSGELHAELTMDLIVGRLEGVRILLAEDGEENQKIFCHFLTLAGAKVCAVSNGALALEAGQKETFDIVLMDIQMPEMDGHQAASALLAHGLEAPIVALTAHALDTERQRCLAGGFADYISKPVGIPELISKIESLVGPEAKQAQLVRSEAQTDEVLYSDLRHNALYAPLLPSFADSLKQRADRIAVARQEGDWEGLASIAHKIRGSGACYGYPCLSELAGEIEFLASSPADQNAEEKVGAKVEDLVCLAEKIHRGVSGDVQA